jgi:hypothetical protein
MNEWTLDADTVIDMVADEPQPTAAPRRRIVDLPRWLQGLLALGPLAITGILVLVGIGRLVGESWIPWAPVWLAGLAMTYLAIAFIAWRSGRLV